jgi:DNA (cytosine-5)-methyltransferase 1
LHHVNKRLEQGRGSNQSTSAPSSRATATRRTFAVADLFCGAGGTSTGCLRAVRALGAELDLVAINHWDTAIATHTRNHPLAKHYCINLDAANPAAIVEGGRLDLLMASPECTHFSRARGGKPVSDQRRASAYHVQRWVMALNGDIDRILIENVREFMEWGPLCNKTPGHSGICNSAATNPDPCRVAAKPRRDGEHARMCIHGYRLGLAHGCGKIDPQTKGRYFFAWVNSLVEMGYDWDYKILNAADHGDATTRERLFVQFVKKGLGGVRWPTATHGKTVKASTKRGAMFGPAPTLKPWRAAREVIDWQDSGRSLLDHPKYQARPLSIKTRMRIARGLARFGGPLAPLYIELLGINPADVAVPAGRGQKPQPFLLSQQSGGAPRSADEPVSTIASAGYVTVVSPFLIGQHTNNTPKRTDESPVPTVMARTMIRLIQPMLAPYYSATKGCVPTDQPVPAIPTKDRFALVDSMAVPYGPRAEARSLGEPLPTVMTHDRLGVAIASVEPFIVPQFGEREGQTPRVHDVEAPLPAVTSHGAGALVQPFVAQFNGDKDGVPRTPRSIEEPLGTITAGGKKHGLVEPLLQAVESGEVDPRRVVLIDGQPYLLDIRFRMLKNRELARAMGFDDAESEYEFTGTATEVTKQIGNAVPVHLAAALITAMLEPALASEAVA